MVYDKLVAISKTGTGRIKIVIQGLLEIPNNMRWRVQTVIDEVVKNVFDSRSG